LRREFIALSICFFIVFLNKLNAQEPALNDTIQLNRLDAEALFLQQNVMLISEKLNIDKARAMVIQARLWPNPTFSIDEVNFWTTTSGTNNETFFGEELPPLIGDFGRSRHFAIQLEQLVQTAGKRKKMIAIEEVSASIAEAYFEDLLRNLKIEFRNNITKLQFLQLYAATFTNQLESVESLVNAFKNQLDQGNISRGEYIRLRALQLELHSELNELTIEKNELQRELKILMNLPANRYLKISTDDFSPQLERLQILNLSQLQQIAAESRPDLNMTRLEEDYYSGLYAYERAQRVPDLNFSVGYDRGGNFLLDFVGFGLSFDLPIFDRNQGNIKYARIGKEQSELLTNFKKNAIQLEVEAAYRSYQSNKTLFESIEADYEEQLDRLLESYTSNFRLRNISMLEYLDFLEAYLENKNIIFETTKKLHDSFEEIQYIIGKELN
jgi:outer membrane protein, heavy metal efflux system